MLHRTIWLGLAVLILATWIYAKVLPFDTKESMATPADVTAVKTTQPDLSIAGPAAVSEPELTRRTLDESTLPFEQQDAVLDAVSSTPYPGRIDTTHQESVPAIEIGNFIDVDDEFSWQGTASEAPPVEIGEYLDVDAPSAY